MTGAATLLRDVFGFDGFRPGQQEIVEAVTEGENVLAIMPTGGGNSSGISAASSCSRFICSTSSRRQFIGSSVRHARSKVEESSDSSSDAGGVSMMPGAVNIGGRRRRGAQR